MAFEKIVLVTRKTRLEGLIDRFNTAAQAKFYIEHSGGDFDFFQREHDVYYRGLEEVRIQLKKTQKVQEINRSFLTNFIFTTKDIVVTFGIDGLVVNTAKYLSGQPLVAVNPDPSNIDGILLPYTVNSVAGVIQKVLDGKFSTKPITMAKTTMKDGQELYAFNDFFVGIDNHTSARYALRQGNREENQSSSGIIISTGAGSTGWLSSFYNFANGMIVQIAGENTSQLKAPALDWSSDRLFYVVREPFVSKTSGATMVCGWILPSNPLVIESHMSSGGIIFSDGVESDFLAFNAGAIATIGVSEKKTNLVVPD
mgnify:CR=1 FL=1